MAKQTYEDFLKTVRAEQLGADGRFLGPQSGTAYYAQGQTPQEYYNAHINDQRATGRFTGYGDNMTAEMEDIGPVSADWVKGPEGNRGLFGGISDMMTNPKTLMGLAAIGGLGALTGFGGAAGAAGGAGGGFTGMGGAGGAMGAGADFGLVGAGAEAAGTAAGAAGTAAGTGGFTGSMLMPELAGSMPAGVTSFSSMIPVAEVGTGFLTPAGTLGGATAVGGGLLGAGTAAEGAAAIAAAGGGGSLLSKAKDFLSNPSNLLQVGGTVLGALGGAAASGDTTTSKSNVNEPWSEAKPYLIDNLKTNAAMAEYYRQNPFSDLQKQQYQGLFNNLANNQANMPAMMANANAFGQSKRGQMPAMQGLLSGTQAAPINWSQYENIGRRG